MPLKTKTPGEGEEKRRVHFCHVPTRQSQSWHAHIAGPCYWCECHTKGRSKPCLKWITDGALHCERCSPLGQPEEIGYQPLYREVDGKPCFVVVHSYTRDIIDKLKNHSRVLVSRGAEQSDGVAVVPALNPKPIYQTSRTDFMRPADLTETLLRVWGIPELTEWYVSQQRPSDNAVSLPKGTAVKQDGTPYSPEMQAPAKRWGADVLPESGELFEHLTNDEFVNRSKNNGKPHTNGKPPPKG